MEQLNDLAIFVSVSENNGFSAAARELGITTAGVSKSIKRLEQRLGVRLFTRTTRRIALTAEGSRFYTRSKEIIDAVIEAENEVTEHAKGVTGRIKIQLPVLFGQQYIVPILAKFRKAYPDIELDMRVSDESVNLLQSGADLAIRVGALKDSSLRARKLTDTRFVSCASPEYLEEHGTPMSLEELSQHTCIAYILKTTGAVYPWVFKVHGKPFEFTPPYSLYVDDGGANKMLGRQGCGIIHDLSLNLHDDLTSGHLVEVLNELSSEGPPIHLIYPDGHYLPKRTRLLIDFILNELNL